MPEPIVMSYGPATALTNAYLAAGIACGLSAAEVNSTELPSKGELSHVEVEITAIAGGATTLTWFLSWDAAGDRHVSPIVTQTIDVGATTATTGTVAARVPIYYKVPDDSVDGVIYFNAKTDVGTCTAAVRVYVKR